MANLFLKIVLTIIVFLPPSYFAYYLLKRAKIPTQIPRARSKVEGLQIGLRDNKQLSYPTNPFQVYFDRFILIVIAFVLAIAILFTILHYV